MREHKIWRQTAVLTCANAITRGAGFVLRVVLSRMLGAQAMGVMTLSHSAHMLFITPVTAGLPLAVSRITARHADARALRAGRSLVLRASAVLIPLWLLLAPLMAYALGDLRVLPSLWVFTPCLAVLGLSAVYNGFCYGLGRAWPPALSEMLEQALRFLLAAGLLLTLPQASVAWRAAMPGVATSIAEAAGLVLKHNFEGGQAVYELDRGGHHDHMVDVDSGKIIEFESPEIEELQRKIAAEHGFELEEHSLVLYVRKKRK